MDDGWRARAVAVAERLREAEAGLQAAERLHHLVGSAQTRAWLVAARTEAREADAQACELLRAGAGG